MTKRPFLLVVLLLSCGIPMLAAANERAVAGEVDETASGSSATVLYGEPVRRVHTGGIDSWRVVDRRRLIFYTSPARPYLVTLRGEGARARPNPIIGLRLRDRSLDARFDSIYVDGFPHSIERIEKLTREVADGLLGIDRSTEDESSR